MIKCALSTETVELLYKNVFGHMTEAAKKGEPFNANSYMKYIFNGKAEKSSPEIAAKIVQHIPRMVIDIANTDFFEEENFVDLNELRSLGQKYLDPQSGIASVINDFAVTDKLNQLKSLAQTKENEAFNIEQVDPEIGQFAERFVPYNPFTGTFQEFIAINPTTKELTYDEKVDESKKVIYATLNAIRNSLTAEPTLYSSINYQGKTLKIKAMPLSSINQADLDEYTKSLIVKSRSIQKQGTGKQEVTPADEIVALVLSDEQGQSLYFDEEGNISTQDAGGRLVYQFLRDARKEGNRYNITNIYGYDDQIASSEYVASKTYSPDMNMSMEEYTAIVDKKRQSDFEKIYNLKNKVISDNEELLLPLTGISQGVPDFLVGGYVNLDKLSSFPNIDRSTFKTIKTVQKTRGIYQKGYATITLNGSDFVIDRADATDSVARQVAAVLTNKNIEFSERLDFYKQFFSNDLQQTTRRHETSGDPLKKEFFFNYSNETSQESKFRNFLENSIDLSEKAVNEKSAEQLKKDEDAIYNVLMTGKGAKNRFPAKMMFNSELLKNERYMTYDFENNEIVFQDYIDFIKTLKTPISIYSGDPGVFNTYMVFAPPSVIIEQVSKIKEAISNDTPSETKQLKDQLVDMLKTSGIIDSDVVSTKKGFAFGKHYANFMVQVPGLAEPVKVYFPNKSVVVNIGGKTFADPTFPKEGDLVRVQLRDSVTDENGITYDNVVEVYGIAEDGTTQSFIGNVAERGYGSTFENARVQPEVDELPIEEAETQTVSDPEIEDDIVINDGINPTSTTTPAANLLRSKFKGLNRSFPADTKVSEKEVEDAVKWWGNSPLNKYITLEHAANLVNSDVFARFIVSGKTLLEKDWWKGKKGKIQIFEKGTMVDVYHEAWHVFSQLYLTVDQKKNLYNAIRGYKDKNGNTPYAKKSYFDIEEMLAEDFRTFAKNPKTFVEKVPIQKTLFQKILNFLYELFFGKPRRNFTLVTKEVDVINYPKTVDQLFKNLYFAGKDPSLLNKYAPKIENVMWEILNRGVERVNNKEEIALSKQDSNLISDSIDSLISETIDEEFEQRKLEGSGTAKSTTLKLLSTEKNIDEETGTEYTNRDITYAIVKDKLQNKLNELRSKLGKITDKPFSSLKTLNDLEDNSVAVIRSKKGEDKYIFLSSQVDEFTNLNPELKKGERVKGEKYKNDVDIIADFYSHKNIKSKSKENVDILVISDIRDAQVQFDAYVRGGDKDFESIEIKETPNFIELAQEQEELLDNVRIIETALNNWGDSKSGVVKYHMENSRFDVIREKSVEIEYGDEIDENGNPIGIDETDAGAGVKDSADLFDKNVGRKSSDQMAGKETLYVIKSLFKIVKDGKKNNHVYNKLGFKELADFNTTWSILLREIGGLKNREEAYNRLVNAANTYAPELLQLVENKLPNPTLITNESEFNVSSAFWQDFSIADIPYIQLTAFPVYNSEGEIESYTTEVIDASIEPSNILRKFQAKFKSIQLQDNPFITKANNITVLTDLENLVKAYEDKKTKGTLDVNKALDFARSIGIYIDDIPVIRKELKKNIEYYGLQYIYDIVKDLADIKANPTKATRDQQDILSKFVIDPISVLKSKIPAKVIKSLKGEEVYQRNIMTRLAELQVRFGLETSNMGVMNAAGDIVYTNVQDFSISRQVDGLNSIENLSDAWTLDEFKYLKYLNPQINSFTKRSQLLRSIFNYESGQFDRRKGKALDLFMVSGTQISETDQGANTIDLDISSKFLQEMHTMLKGGVQEFIRNAGKKTSLGVKVAGGLIKDRGKDSKLYVDIDMFLPNATGESYAANKILIPHMAAEYERIIKFKDNKKEFLKYGGYNKRVAGTKESPVYAGEVFTAFDNVLTKETKEKLLSPEVLDAVKELNNDLATYLKRNPQLRAQVEKDMIAYFNEQTSNNINLLGDLSYIDKAVIEKITDPNITEREKVGILVKAFTYNSWIHNFETVNLFYGDMAQYNHIKEELHKRNTGAQSGGRKFLTDDNAQKFINNVWNKKTYAAKLGDRYNKFVYDGTVNTAIIKDIERPSIYINQIEAGLREDYTKSLKKYGKSDKEIEEIIDKRLKKELKAYREMNEADGAGYVTFDAYRTLRKLENNWSDKQEALYQDIINNRPITASKVLEYFPVYKLQNYGPLNNNTLAPLTAMHKFALQPLIPSVIKGSELDHLHKEMMRGNIQYVTFESGSKVSGVTADGNPDIIFTDDTQTKLKDELTFTPNIVPLEYVKNVTEVNTEYKGTITFPTQMRGLILDGLYEEGEIPNEKNEPTAERYHNAVKNYTEILKLQLLDEIEYEEKDGRYTGNLSKFLDLIQKELTKRDMPEHLVKFVGVNNDKTLKTDLSLHLEADTIEKILLSVINKRLIRQKIKGEALIQVPSTMYNGLWDTGIKFDRADKEQEQKFLGSNTLPFYTRNADGTSNAMKIAIALQGDFVNLLKLQYNGKEIGNIDTLNQAIKDDNWLKDNRDSITLSGGRIPIQGLNSLEFAEVWHFLDPSAGNMVVIPSEIVAKAGSDFDVDKIYWMMPNIDSRGNYVKSSKSNKELMDEISKLKGKSEKDKNAQSSTKLIAKQKAALENELIVASKDILSLADNYPALVRPNETYIVQPLAEELQEFVVDYNRFENMHKEETKFSPNDPNKKIISPTRVLEIGYNLHKHDVNTVGKNTLGIDALDNKQHPIWNSVGAKMPKTYKDADFDDYQKKYVENNISYDMRLLLNHNKTKDGNISLSKRYNTAGTRIADLRSHKMNGLLDVEKDAWVFFIQANLETTPILNYLIDAGVSEKDAIYFVSEKLVREYGKQQRILKSAYSTLAYKKEIDSKFIKSQAAKIVENFIPERIRSEIYKKATLKRIDDVLNLEKPNSQLNVKIGKNNYTTTVDELKELISSKEVNAFQINQISSFKDPFLYVKSNSLVTNKMYYYAAEAASELAGLKKGEFFSTEELEKIAKNPGDPKNQIKEAAIFLHFIEIEKQIKGISGVKRQANPDTKVNKTVQQLKKKDVSFEDLLESSKVDPELLLKLKNESILSSFYLNDVSIDLVTPLFPLRLNEKISDYIAESTKQLANLITKKYGKGVDGEERFTNMFNNGVISYIFQNYMSNFTDTKGDIVSLPDEYREMKIIKSKDIPNGVKIDGNTILVDEAKITSDYKNRVYIQGSTSPDSYEATGLRPFLEEDNPFPSQTSYNKYVIEREYLRDLYSDLEIKDSQKQAFELFLNKKALINAFNQKSIMGTTEYSYTDQVMEIINNYPELKEKYPVLGQLSQAPYKNKRGENIKVLQLNNKALAKADLAEIYRQNLKQLGDITIRKSKSDVENKRISDVFRPFSLMMLYQHGVGYSKYGFPKILDESDFVSVMRSAADSFIENHINNGTLNTILNNVLSDATFKNFVVTPYDYNNPTTERHENSNVEELYETLNEYIKNNTPKDLVEILNKYPNIGVIAIPEGATNGQYLDNAYNIYHELYDNTMLNFNFKTYIDRLKLAGVDIDNATDIFHDFSTDTDMSVSEFLDMIKPELESEQEITPTDQPSTQGTVKPTIDTSREWKGDLESALVYDKTNPKLVNTMRTSTAKANEHFGNPFSEAGYAGTIKVPSIGAAVIAYKNWLTTNLEIVSRYSDSDVKSNPNKIYVFGDNTQRTGTGGQAQIRNNTNAIGIATKLKPSNAEDAFMSDKNLTNNKSIIDSDIAKIKATKKVVVFPKDGLGTGLAKLKEKAPQTYEYLKQRLLEEFGFNNDTGTQIKLEQRAWILNQINQGKLDGATLLYAGKSERRGQGMHPTALAEVVEELRSKQLSSQGIDEVKEEFEEIEKFYFELMDYSAASGEKLSKNLPTLEEAIEEYHQMYASTLTQKQYIDNVLKCKL
jgi:hypothetical protein